MLDLVIIGTGGVGRALKHFVDELNRLELRWRLRGFIDDSSATTQQTGGLPTLGPLEWLAGKTDCHAFLGIGEPIPRRKIV
jgi:hypothetical protein